MNNISEIVIQSAAELEVHPNGKWMYFSNRISGAIVVFEVQDDGNLTFLQVIKMHR